MKFKLKHFKKWEKTDVSELPTGEAVVNVLKRNGVKTMGQLVDNWDKISNNRLKDIGAMKGKKIRVAFVQWYGSILSDESQIDFLDDIATLNAREKL